EPELRRHLGALAARNADAAGAAVFLGAGAYPHWVPAVVDQILLRSEFATAYTPYQPEVSQGTLQATFEFQTFSALLLGLEVASASLYDGASATAEAVLMARRLRPGRRVVWLARALHPHYRATVATYLRGLGGVEVREVPFGADGRTDLGALRAGLGGDTLCLVLGYPNVFGVVEHVALFADAVRAVGALTITATPEALALALVRSPGPSGVDIAVAARQSFGLPRGGRGPGALRGALLQRVRRPGTRGGARVGSGRAGRGRGRVPARPLVPGAGGQPRPLRDRDPHARAGRSADRRARGAGAGRACCGWMSRCSTNRSSSSGDRPGESAGRCGRPRVRASPTCRRTSGARTRWRACPRGASWR